MPAGSIWQCDTCGVLWELRRGWFTGAHFKKVEDDAR
jgi:hypothetical protein